MADSWSSPKRRARGAGTGWPWNAAAMSMVVHSSMRRSFQAAWVASSKKRSSLDAFGAEALAELVTEHVPVGGVFSGQEYVAGGEAVGDGVLCDLGFSFRGDRPVRVLRVGAVGGELFLR